MELLGNSLAHAMHLTLAAGTRLLIVGEVILDALAWQVFRQRVCVHAFFPFDRERDEHPTFPF